MNKSQLLIYIKHNSRIVKFFSLFVIVILSEFIGVFLNNIVMISNGGKMPVLSSYDYETDTHFSFSEPKEVNKYLLTDIIHFNGRIMSIGDIFIYFGFFSMLLVGVVLLTLVHKMRKQEKLVNKEIKKYDVMVRNG